MKTLNGRSSSPVAHVVHNTTGDAGASHPVDDLAMVAVLHRAALAFNATLELPDVIQAVLDEVEAAVPAHGYSLWLAETTISAGDTAIARAGAAGVVCHGVRGTTDPSWVDREVAVGQGVVGRVVADGTTVDAEDVPLSRALDGGSLNGGEPPRAALLCVPLNLHQKGKEGRAPTLGAILVTHTAGTAFAKETVALLEALSASAAAAIENAHLYHQAEHEIVERRRAEDALRYSETQYRTLVETSPDAISVIGPGGTITMCNRRAAELHGYDHTADLIGRSFLVLVAPSSRAAILSLYRRALEGHAIRKQELTLMRKDGSYFEAEYAASLIASNGKDGVSVVGFARDITDRRAAENIIRRHNQELRTLNAIAARTSQAHDISQILRVAISHALQEFHVDAGWAVAFDLDRGEAVLSATIRGGSSLPDLTTDEIPLYQWLKDRICSSGKPLLVSTSELPAEWIAEDTLCPVAAAPLLSQGSVTGILTVLGIYNRQPHPIRFQQVQLLSAIGHQVGIAIQNARLSEKVNEIAMLRELNAMRSELVASFSHDLRSPLGLIKMACSTLQRDDVVLDPELVEELLQDISGQTDRLARLVDEILDLGRLESGHLALQRTELDLGKLLRDLAAEVERVHEGYWLTVDVTGEDTTAWADPSRIEQVLRNLLDNALKYTPEPGEIVARIRRHQHRLYVSIIDKGIGIPAKERDLVFERFYRVNNEETRRVSGDGLGLATCRGIVEAHGGQIWIEGESEPAGAPQRGTTVTFTLPAAPFAPPDPGYS